MKRLEDCKAGDYGWIMVYDQARRVQMKPDESGRGFYPKCIGDIQCPHPCPPIYDSATEAYEAAIAHVQKQVERLEARLRKLQKGHSEAESHEKRNG